MAVTSQIQLTSLFQHIDSDDDWVDHALAAGFGVLTYGGFGPTFGASTASFAGSAFGGGFGMQPGQGLSVEQLASGAYVTATFNASGMDLIWHELDGSSFRTVVVNDPGTFMPELARTGEGFVVASSDQDFPGVRTVDLRFYKLDGTLVREVSSSPFAFGTNVDLNVTGLGTTGSSGVAAFVVPADGGNEIRWISGLGQGSIAANAYHNFVEVEANGAGFIIAADHGDVLGRTVIRLNHFDQRGDLSRTTDFAVGDITLTSLSMDRLDAGALLLTYADQDANTHLMVLDPTGSTVIYQQTLETIEGLGSRSPLVAAMQASQFAIATRFEFDDIGNLAGSIEVAQYRITRDILGTAAADRIMASEEGLSQRINGAAGNDQLTGSRAADELDGGIGNDTLDGGRGSDLMRGGLGNDSFVVRDEGGPGVGDTVIELAGEGTDTVIAHVNYDLALNVENLTVAAGALVAIAGGNGLNNTITGNELGQVLRGFGGNDVLDGRGGADTMSGGVGNDSYVVSDAGDVVNELANEGTDTVTSSIADYQLTAHVEKLVLATGAVVGRGNDLNNQITGNAAANELHGNGGNDRLDGRGGADIMFGGDGDDTYFVDHPSDQVIEAAGTAAGRKDTVNIGAGAGDYTLGSNVENGTLTGNVYQALYGNDLNNSLTAKGGSAWQFLYGLEGNDTLKGGNGVNFLYGGAGRDTLTGGGGLDLFIFSELETSANRDTIRDFSSAQGDKLEFDGSVFTELTRALSGQLDPAAFRLGTAAGDADDRMIYNQASGELWYDVDGTGAGAQILVAVLSNNAALGADNIFIF